MVQPPPLDYLPPRDTRSPARLLACRHASSNGSASILLAMAFGLTAWLAARFGATPLAVVFDAACSAVFFTFGILYVVGSVQIVSRNRPWEHRMAVLASSHIALILTLVLIGLALALTGPFLHHMAVVWFAVTGACAILIAAFLGRMILLLARLQREV